MRPDFRDRPSTSDGFGRCADCGRSRHAVGVTAGVFDLLHPGHIWMLDDCKAKCEYLIVGICDDPTVDRPTIKRSPVLSAEMRAVVVAAIRHVDEVFIYRTEQDLETAIARRPEIDVRFVGADWSPRLQFRTGDPFAWHINPRDHEFSSSLLRSRILAAGAAPELSNNSEETADSASDLLIVSD